MLIEEQDLQPVLQQWFNAALPFLSHTQPPLRNKRSLTRDDFGNMQARVGGGYEIDTWNWIEQNSKPLARLPETDIVRSVLLALAPAVFPRNAEGTISHDMLSDHEYVYSRFLCPLLREHVFTEGQKPPSSASLADMSMKIMDFMRRPIMLFTPSLVMLDGLQSSLPLMLEDGVELRATTALEKRQIYFGEDAHIPIFDGLLSGGERGFAPNYVLEITEDHFQHATAIDEAFVFACRLLGFPSIGYRYIEQKSDNPIRQSGYSRVGPTYGGRASFDEVQLDQDFCDALCAHWKRFCSLHDDRDWHIAVSRYGQSYSRPSFEDQIVDLCVALEAIFAQESKEGEISFRIALRASRLLKTDPDDRLEMFRLIKRAYNDRSVVVHGNAITKNKDWNRIIESIPALRDILGQVLLRAALDDWSPEYPRMDFIDTHQVHQEQETAEDGC